ncbi:MAG TPA: protein-glutamate O-methyltransferase CheR [Thermoanaerobaculia bacterium]|nr:protein-glutamate O-methyltransferase CheR [Thermoanaerobaculia bacterium]
MPLTPRPDVMTEEEHLLLNELISERFGINFPEHKRELLEARLRPRLQALRLPRYLDYYLQLVCDGEGEREFLAQMVTNNETFFFRETHQFEALLDAALDDLREGAALPGSLRLLSAGCSSGEEPYTLGIFARQSFVRLAGTHVTIDAFDLDASRIEMARQAEYTQTSLRALTPEQIERHFTLLPSPAPPSFLSAVTGFDRWALKPAYRSGIQFHPGNILDFSSFGLGPAYDAVFCRNVLIYFAEPALHLAVSHFARALRPGGLLFLGAAESIIGLSDQFETIRLRDTIAYRKVGR